MYGGFEYAETSSIDLEDDYTYTAKNGLCKASTFKG